MKLIKLFISLLFIAGISVAFNMGTGIDPRISFGILLFFGMLGSGKKHGFAYMAVDVEVWQTDILENLFKDNAFAARAYNADQFVLGGKVVHIPRAGSASATTKNRSNFPATAVRRSDDDVTYSIDTYRTDPTHVLNIEQYERSYDKRQSVLGEDQAALIETAMDGLLYNWAPGVSKVVFTKGDDRAATISGATGNRKKFTKASLEEIKLLMDTNKIPDKGRVALLTAVHYNDFFNSLSDAEKTNFHNVANLAEGVVGRYLGFDVMMRATVLRYRGADEAVAVVDEYAAGFEASDKTSDRAASLVYHDKCAERAKGSVEMFENVNDPTYYGSVYSFELRLGGRIRRDAGVYAVVEAIAGGE